ncbi:MAG: putative quinol monooxygenase [Verrucomicrobia bacterium]|nr:putative quinol monooxygenase [Verrucomicrobiota bacterium]
MYIVQVFMHAKPECLDNFLLATEDNASHSRQEPGVVRFDVIQQVDDPARVGLIEVYKTPEDFEHHKQTSHYARWRDAVPDMMAEPRHSFKYRNVSPDDSQWVLSAECLVRKTEH